MSGIADATLYAYNDLYTDTFTNEADDELRARLRYVTGEAITDAGVALEARAARYGLGRRKINLLLPSKKQEDRWQEDKWEREYLGRGKDLT